MDTLDNLTTTIADAGYLGEDAMSEFLWLVIIGGFVCFAMAWGIGANDVANAFATSVGAKAVTLKQATMIAAVFEFVGAIALGSEVTSTVRKGIVDYDLYVGEEDLLMLGMFCALTSASIWLYIATKYSLPISTTQAVIGAIAGFAIVSRGTEAVLWDKIVDIIIFWVASPILSAIGAIIFFLPIRHFLLRREDSYKQTLRWWWIFVFIVVFIMILFLLLKGLKKISYSFEEQVGFSFLITFATAFGVSIIAYFIFVKSGLVDRFVQRRVAREQQRNEDLSNVAQNDEEMATIKQPDSPTTDEPEPDHDPEQERSNVVESKLENVGNPKLKKGESRMELLSAKLTHGVNVNIHDDLEKLELDIHKNAEKFDPKTEMAFAHLQVSTAALDIFAHGSNDVANAVAPFAAIVALYETGRADEKVEVHTWILAIGALGLTIGLATYGYKIMKCLGVRMAPMTPTRGYSIELSSALVVIIASAYGFPASTTHAQVGATVGAGLMELFAPNATLTFSQVINWKLLATVFFGWILTLFVSGVSCAALYSILAYSPYAGGVVRG